MFTEYDYEIYGKLGEVKTYKRNIVGTVVLSCIILIGMALFLFRQIGQFFGGASSWTILGNFFVPPIQFIVYGMMVLDDPGNNVDTLCMLGRILIPLISFSYCAFMLYMSYIHSSVPEFVFYVFLAFVQTVLILPKRKSDWWWWLKPFLKRPEEEIENERSEIIKNYKMPST